MCIYMYLYKMHCANDINWNTFNFKAQSKTVERRIGSKNATYIKGITATEKLKNINHSEKLGY